MSNPNCYDCKWRRNIPGDTHSECVHPKISGADRLLTPIILMSGSQNAPAQKRLNVTGDPHGIRRGWFAWPLNFDPVWLQTCDGFEGKEVETMRSERNGDENPAVSLTKATNAASATNSTNA